MIANLLVTKLYQPARSANQVSRPRLVERLNEGLAAGRPLTLISAPAGFGKTTCVSEWLDSLDCPSSWLSLEKADDDAARFFTYFLAALQKIDKTLGQELENVLRSGQLPSLDAFTTTLINNILQFDHKFILILDDFHVIQDRIILQLIERLLSNQPPQMHLVLITREDPSLALSRLRANNRMTEIRAGDLRFAFDEAGQFFSETMGLTLNQEDIDLLENRTEGWVVGLQLAGLSMRGRKDTSGFIAALSGNHRYILSYLTEEVLSRQPEEVQAFLAQTSILNKLSGDLCDAVTGRTDSSYLLERMFNANLFLISLDDEQLWYRYHHLFADLLRSQHSRLPKDLIIQLHQRASQWYEQAGMPGEAIEHALSAGDFPRAVRLIEAHAMRMILQGYIKTVEGWMHAVPPEWHAHSPKTNLAFAWLFLLHGDYQKVNDYLNQAEQAITQTDLPADEAAILRAEWLSIRANLVNVQGKPLDGIELANQAIQSVSPTNAYIRGVAFLGLGAAYRLLDDYPRLVEAYQNSIKNSRISENTFCEIMAVSGLTLMAIQHGEMRFAMDVGSQLIERIERTGLMMHPVMGTVIGPLGSIYYEWNQIDKARERFESASRLSALAGHNAGQAYSRVILSRLYLAEGDLETAAQLTQEAAEMLPFGVPAWVKPEVAYQQIRVYLAEGNLAAAENVLKQTNIPVPGRPPQPLEILLNLGYLRVILYQAQEKRQEVDLQKAILLAGQILDGASKAQRLSIALQALLLRAQMFLALGNREASFADLEHALKLAGAEGYIRTFLDEGPQIAALLKNHLGQTRYPDYARKLLAAFSVTTQEAAALPQQDALVEPLSERELDVLRLIAKGLKYEEIAESLVITLNTVRYHVKAIYSKLGVNSRARAVELARELGLI